MIGPAIPNPESSSSPPVGLSIGPQIPQHLQSQPDLAGEDDDEDDYVPALPPDLIAQRTSTKRVLGPTLPSMTSRDEADEDEDDVGPMPLPSAYLNSLQEEEKDGVTEFLEREQRRKKAIEVRAASSLLLGFLDIEPEVYYYRKLQNQKLFNEKNGCWFHPALLIF